VIPNKTPRQNALFTRARASVSVRLMKRTETETAPVRHYDMISARFHFLILIFMAAIKAGGQN
jgi:hypothetical protein